MIDLMEIKNRLERIAKLSNEMREQFGRLSGTEGAEIKKKARKDGTRVGIGIGIAVFGLLLAAVAAVYILAVIILLVNIALDRLWLSSLIVVGGFLLTGGGILAGGIAMASSGGKELSKLTDEPRKQMKETGEQLKAELDALQKMAKNESSDLQEQVTEAAKFATPAATAAFLGFRLFRRQMRRRQEKRMMIKAVKMVDEARAKRERAEAE
ncbi:MAG: phage holin family protein [Actinobacteria bacterium]|nr:phage holin family protein [Actinomycetota bacterium]